MRSIRQVDTCMILQLIGYNIPALLNSNLAAAICQVEDGEPLKSLVMLVRETGWGVVVVQTVSGDHFVVATAHRKHQGNLLGDTRRWTREHGYQFFMKLSDDKFPTPRLILKTSLFPKKRQPGPRLPMLRRIEPPKRLPSRCEPNQTT